MKRYRETLFEPVSDLKKQIALTKLLHAASDAQNRQLEASDRGHHNMSRFYSSINLLCLQRLLLLIRFTFSPADYHYSGRFYADGSIGHTTVLSNVRDWRLRHRGVVPLGRNFKRII